MMSEFNVEVMVCLCQVWRKMEYLLLKGLNKDVEPMVSNYISSAQFNDVLSSLPIIIIIDTFFAEFEVEVLFEGRPSL